MAVTTIDTVVTNVMFMTELNRLLPFDPLTGVPGRTIQLNCDPKQSNNYENRAINRNLCERVGAVMEDLWHPRVSSTCRVASQTGTLADKQPTNFSPSKTYCYV